MLYYVRCKYMFEYLAKNTGEGNRPEICRLFLKTGITLAFVQSAGSLPVCNDRSKMTLMIGAFSSRSSLGKRGLSLSGPAALSGLRLWSNFSSPFRDMSISGMFMLLSCCLSGMVSEGRPPAFLKSCTHILARRESDRGSLDVKMELKC